MFFKGFNGFNGFRGFKVLVVFALLGFSGFRGRLAMLINMVLGDLAGPYILIACVMFQLGTSSACSAIFGVSACSGSTLRVLTIGKKQ